MIASHLTFGRYHQEDLTRLRHSSPPDTHARWRRIPQIIVKISETLHIVINGATRQMPFLFHKWSFLDVSRPTSWPPPPQTC